MIVLPATVSAQELRGSLGPAPLVTEGAAPELPTTDRPLSESSALDTGGLDPNAALDPDSTENGVAPAESPNPVLPARRRPATEQDPYAPLGLRVGSFIVKPGVDQRVGYNSNPRNENGGEGSAYSRTLGRVEVQSDWLRHELRGAVQGGYTAYREFPDLDAPDFSGDVAARIDARRDLQIDLALRGASESESPGDPDLPDGITGRPQVSRIGGTVGATLKPNRASLGIQALADRVIYEDAELNNGDVVDNSDRTYTAYELRLRTGYELSEALEPFVEGSVNTRDHDREVDDLGIERNSRGYEIAVGTRFEPSVLLAVEGKVGYRAQNPDDPNLPLLDGLVADGSLIWRPTALTTVTLTADTTVDETTRADSSGALVRTATARVDHALRRNLLLTGSLAFRRSDYAGVDYRIDEINAELGLEYRFTRTVAVHGRIAHEDYSTTIPGEDYTATIVEAGLRVMR